MTGAAAPETLDEAVARLRGWQAMGRHADARTEAEARLAIQPDHRDLLLILAHALRHEGAIDAALHRLDRLLATRPHDSRLHEERGLCHIARRDAPAATAALLQAVNLNPALPMAWRMLAGVYRLSGDAANASTAAGHVAALAALPPAIVQATALFFDGEMTAAEAIVRDHLLTHGDHPEAMRLLARIGMAQDVLDDAELLLAGALALAPDHHAARHDYAQCLIQRHKHREAQAEVARLLATDPHHRAYRALAATVAVGLGDHDGAIAHYRALLADRADDADLHLWLGHALKTVGDLPGAIEAYRAAAAARPAFGDAYWSLANLKRYRFAPEEIARMTEGETDPATGEDDRIHLNFALGKAHEDCGDHARSWRHYARGNALRRAASRYRPEIIETNTDRQKAVCTPAFFAARAGWGVPAPDPIFVLGLPRAGSTLIEQILASHSRVEGTQELADIQRIVLDLQGRDPDLDDPRYPGVLETLDAGEVRRLGQRYLDDTRVYRNGDRPFFIDKMPNNFRHIGLIHLMLPRARIIDARREPMACCFSNLKQLFAQGQEFTYSVGDIARYYRTYLDLMEHWDAALPGRVLRVHHEDVVDDLEGSVRRILAYLGLPFEQSCVDFHRNRRSVRTPSSEQVRQPIFRDSLDQWRRYEPWLAPLAAALGDARERYRG